MAVAWISMIGLWSKTSPVISKIPDGQIRNETQKTREEGKETSFCQKSTPKTRKAQVKQNLSVRKKTSCSTHFASKKMGFEQVSKVPPTPCFLDAEAHILLQKVGFEHVSKVPPTPCFLDAEAHILLQKMGFEQVSKVPPTPCFLDAEAHICFENGFLGTRFLKKLREHFSFFGKF